jgi:large subunit ribosomal protein L17
MRHGYFGRNLSRPVGKRLELFKSLLGELVRRGKIQTTLIKAKAVRGDLDKLINTAKKQTVAARADLEKTLTPELAKKLFREVKEGVFDGRRSGYARLTKLGRRFSDDSPMAELELIKNPPPAPAENETAAIPSSQSRTKKKSLDKKTSKV